MRETERGLMIQQQDEEGRHTEYRKHGGTVVDDLAREAMHQPLVFYVIAKLLYTLFTFGDDSKDKQEDLHKTKNQPTALDAKTQKLSY